MFFKPNPHKLILKQYGCKNHSQRLGRSWSGWRVWLFTVEEQPNGHYNYPMLPEEVQAEIKQAAKWWSDLHGNNLIIIEGPRGKESYYLQGRCIHGPGRIVW